MDAHEIGFGDDFDVDGFASTGIEKKRFGRELVADLGGDEFCSVVSNGSETELEEEEIVVGLGCNRKRRHCFLLRSVPEISSDAFTYKPSFLSFHFLSLSHTFSHFLFLCLVPWNSCYIENIYKLDIYESVCLDEAVAGRR